MADYTPGISEKRGGTSSYRSGDLKSFDVQTNSTAGVSGKHTYDAFGRLDTSTGTWTGPFGFGGQYEYQTDGSGLQILGNRWYDAEVGRFLTRDPSMEGSNWYAYCDNDPTGFEDALGLKPGDKFGSYDAAAKDAGHEYRGQPDWQRREYGGYVYQNPDGSFSYTFEPGTDDGRIPYHRGKIPAGAKPKGSWHAHTPIYPEAPHSGAGTGMGGNLEPGKDIFSDPDVDIFHRGHDQYGEDWSWLISADGIIYRYEPPADGVWPKSATGLKRTPISHWRENI